LAFVFGVKEETKGEKKYSGIKSDKKPTDFVYSSQANNFTGKGFLDRKFKQN
jgi:hypothetical protein